MSVSPMIEEKVKERLSKGGRKRWGLLEVKTSGKGEGGFSDFKYGGACAIWPAVVRKGKSIPHLHLVESA